MIKDCDTEQIVLNRFLKFIGNDILVGHNVNFDIDFIYDRNLIYNHTKFQNNYVDTRRIARKLYPEWSRYKLKDLCLHLNIQNNKAHNSLSDAKATAQCLNKMYVYGIQKYGSKQAMIEALTIHHAKSFNAKEIKCIDKNTLDPDNLLYHRHICFTGTLDKMLRKDAAQIAANIGAIIDNGITKKTNYLILGNLAYSHYMKNNKSTKLLKAEKYILKGYDLHILDENTFYDLIGE